MARIRAPVERILARLGRCESVSGLIGLIIIGGVVAAVIGGSDGDLVTAEAVDITLAGGTDEVETLVDEPELEPPPENEPEPPPENEPEPAPTPEPDNAPAESTAPTTRESPLPMGDSIRVTAEAFGDADGSIWSLTVTGPAQDVTATAMSDGFASEPAEGNILVGVPFELILVASSKEPLAPSFNVETEFFSPTDAAIAVSTFSCGFWDEAFDSTTQVFVGGKITGLLCAEVPLSDLDGGLLVTADEAGDRIFPATN